MWCDAELTALRRKFGYRGTCPACTLALKAVESRTAVDLFAICTGSSSWMCDEPVSVRVLFVELWNGRGMSKRYPGVSTGLSVPNEWSDIDPEWMTVALAQRYPEIRVGQVDVELRDDGTNRRARLASSYLEGGGPATLPRSPRSRAQELIRATSGLFHEPRLFTAGVSLPLDHPAAYAADVVVGHAERGRSVAAAGHRLCARRALFGGLCRSGDVRRARRSRRLRSPA